MLWDSHIQPVSVILQDFHGIPVVQGVNDAVVQALAGTDIQIGAVRLNGANLFLFGRCGSLRDEKKKPVELFTLCRRYQVTRFYCFLYPASSKPAKNAQSADPASIAAARFLFCFMP